MGQPIKLITKKGTVRKDGTSLIFVQYCHSADKRILLSTGVAIPPNFWNKKTGRISESLPEEFGDAQQLQIILIQHLRKAEDMLEYALAKRKVCPMQFLKTNFSLPATWALPQMQETPQELNVFFQIDQYIKEKSDAVKSCTIGVIIEMKDRLKAFETYRKKPVTFDSFDMNFMKILFVISLMIIYTREAN